MRLDSDEITLSNSGAEALEIRVEDQIPVSGNQEIAVKILDIGNGNFNSESGAINWNVMLLAKQSKKIRFSFEVSYPNDKIISSF